MTANNETETLHSVALADCPDGWESTLSDRVSRAGVIEPQCLTDWVTQHMTATWGN